MQIFDQKKFKKKDQGFLGVINVRVGDVVDFSSGQDRECSCHFHACMTDPLSHRDAYKRSQKVNGQSGCSWKANHQLVY